ncbi:OsmC family peroxiredoxin, partial [Streptosporangium sp. NPDC048865]|uniref:OsmC family peroxiredoxin n=1 Tax=Streptosporangium sp. NPDC048865 TaxID=3155766 RepID=UPI0034424604
MATTRTATTQWEGPLLTGSGNVSLNSSGVGTFAVSWPSRAEEANGKTSPEELIAAAHSSCFSMALSHGLAQAGTPPQTVETRADVTFQPGEGRRPISNQRTEKRVMTTLRDAPSATVRPPRHA